MNYSYSGDSRRAGALLLGSPAQYRRLYEDHLPVRLLYSFGRSDPAARPQVRLAEEVSGLGEYDVDATLFALPSNQVVLAVSFEFTCDPDDPRPIVGLLDQTIYDRLLVMDQSLDTFVQGLRHEIDGLRADPVGLSYRDRIPRPELTPVILLPERHQLVFLRSGRVPSAANVHEIVYRKDPPYTQEFARPKEPEQLNRYRLPSEQPGRPSWRQLLRHDGPVPDDDKHQETLGVVTPYVSLLYGHKDYVESSVILSTVHAVGTASRFRQIWHETFDQVRRFRDTKQEATAGKQTRKSLEELADNLGNLEFDLTFSVEFPLMRAMRIESFQNALHEALDLTTQAGRLGEMFSQVSSSIQSEITAIKVREQRRSENKQKWNAFAATILSLLGVSVGFVIAFLGINTSEVTGASAPQVSMWDARFAPLYLTATLFALAPAYFICLPYLKDWTRPHHGNNDRLALGAGLAAVGCGIVLVLLADRLFQIGSHLDIALDAALTALGYFGITVGASLTLLWLWNRPSSAPR